MNQRFFHMLGRMRRLAANGACGTVAALVCCAVLRAAEPISPVAVPYSSGLAFPQARDPTHPPDPRHAASKAIDRYPATFCCLLDDFQVGEIELLTGA